jgi:hypothetical protein
MPGRSLLTPLTHAETSHLQLDALGRCGRIAVPHHMTWQVLGMMAERPLP